MKEKKLCPIILKYSFRYRSYGPDKAGRTDACTLAYTAKRCCGVSLTSLDKYEIFLFEDSCESKSDYNQSVENAGVTFVKGANERNAFFKK